MTNNKTLPSYFISWSGGKDACLALYRCCLQWGKPRYLFNMLTEDGERSRLHGLTKQVLMAQADYLEIPILFCSARWGDMSIRLCLDLKIYWLRFHISSLLITFQVNLSWLKWPLSFAVVRDGHEVFLWQAPILGCK